MNQAEARVRGEALAVTDLDLKKKITDLTKEISDFKPVLDGI